ncbi:MAG: type II toxin-antitoxin system RelE/ParE family toxin, partial [Niabella sp.]|nr:type II toxin-antitoxin system RelE/ParE family toxin [Niabella sp.]
LLETDPGVLRIRYKNVRAIKLKGFPYLLYYVVIEQKNVVKILACFHNRRNPATLP